MGEIAESRYGRTHKVCRVSVGILSFSGLGSVRRKPRRHVGADEAVLLKIQRDGSFILGIKIYLRKQVDTWL